jgi:UDP-N-acetylglucosamine:LPS N-acetylglucosamine transferase
VWNLLRNAILAWRTIARSRPDVIVSTGAGVAFPFFLIGKLRGAKTVYIEVFDRFDSPTMTGRLCAPFSDRFLLQWEEQKRQYPKGEVVGPLL